MVGEGVGIGREGWDEGGRWGSYRHRPSCLLSAVGLASTPRPQEPLQIKLHLDGGRIGAA